MSCAPCGQAAVVPGNTPMLVQPQSLSELRVDDHGLACVKLNPGSTFTYQGNGYIADGQPIRLPAAIALGLIQIRSATECAP